MDRTTKISTRLRAENRSSPEPGSPPPERRSRLLESWKEIADYLNRKVRTCQVWEKDLGLPVHRLDGSPRARVFAYSDELDRWLDDKLHEKETRPARAVFQWLVRKRGVVLSFAAVIVVTVFGSSAWHLFSPRKGPLAGSGKPSLMVISFENQTGNEALDYLKNAIPNLLITNLEKSGDFEVMTRERMRDLLKQMGKAEAESIDKDLGFEICRIGSVDAVILGSYTKAGDVFVTDVKVVDAASKRLLKSASAKGVGDRSILEKQIDALSREIRRGWRFPKRNKPLNSNARR